MRSVWREFIKLAEKREEPFAALCARFGVSRKTGYKWLNRYRADGEAGLRQQSRRPKSSPRRTPGNVVEAVFAVRQSQPAWSVAKIHRQLEEQGIVPLPAPSTIDLILRRRREAHAAHQQALGAEARRFEPNFRWVVVMGMEATLADGAVTTPAIMRDETTGFYVGAELLNRHDDDAIRVFAEGLFKRHGLPWRMVVEREATLRDCPACQSHTGFTVWLIQLGIHVEFVFHTPGPAGGAQTAARRQLAARLAALPAYQRGALTDHAFFADPLEQFALEARKLTFETATAMLEKLREQHNFGGKHEAMQRRSPISLFRPSARLYPEVVMDQPYAPEATLRQVSEKGVFTFQQRLVQVGRPFSGHSVEIKLTQHADRYIVLFLGHVLGLLDISTASEGAKTSLLPDGI